jgi:hypothetical protein
MLAQYLVWHLRHALAPLTYTDEQLLGATLRGHEEASFRH